MDGLLSFYRDAEILEDRLVRAYVRCRYFPPRRANALMKSGDPAPLQYAALLHRIGELCVVSQAQAWEHKGHSLSESTLTQAMRELSTPFASALKLTGGCPWPCGTLLAQSTSCRQRNFVEKKCLCVWPQQKSMARNRAAWSACDALRALPETTHGVVFDPC